MIFLSLTVLLIYLGFVLWLWRGVKSAAAFQPDTTPREFTPFSVIIAAHNEEETIGETLNRFLNQQYPPEKFEIVVVADRCRDGTVGIVRELIRKHANISLKSIEEVPEGISPKKNALVKGIGKARFDRLVFMDADCLPGPLYLATLNRYFQSGAEVVVNIPKVRVEKNLLHSYLLPERLVTWSIAAAGVGHRSPFLAFGGSWAYRRDLLERSGGFAEISHSLSGDDDLLIYRMGKLNPQMAVCFEPEGWVTTGLPGSVKSFFRQRRRHHSAGKYYAGKVKTGYAVFHAANLLLWVLPLFFLPATIPLLAKILADALVLFYSARLFRERISFVNLLFFEIGYLLHNLIIAPLGFVGRVRWK